MVSSKNNILIIGGGRIGQKLKEVLQKNKPLIWDIDPKISDSKKTLKEEIKNKNFIFLCIPSVAYQEVLPQIEKQIDSDTIIISLSKGLDSQGNFIYKTLQKTFQGLCNFGMMGGPIMAEEIGKTKPAVAQIGLSNMTDYLKVKELFSDSPIKIIGSRDPLGISIAGALKNVYALFLGITEALVLGDNLKAYFTVKAIREMKKLGQKYGARLETLNSICGIGDFVLTGFNPHSRDKETGEKLVKGERLEKSEGLHSLGFLVKIKSASWRKEKLPLLSALEEITFNHKDAQETVLNLLPH